MGIFEDVGNWSPICRRVVHFGSPMVQVVHEWFDWFTTGTLWFASGSTGSLWFAGGSSGSRLVHVVHRWFKWFTTGSRSSGVVDVVRAHNLMESVESQPAESREEWSVSMFIQCRMSDNRPLYRPLFLSSEIGLNGPKFIFGNFLTVESHTLC